MSNLATVITGASSGIGEQLAKQLAAQEQQTLVLVARSTDKLHALAEQLKQAHPIRVEVISLDLEQVGAAQQLVKVVQDLGLDIDTLINNAGFGLNDLFADMPLERIQGMMQLNMVALTELCHAVLPAMRQRKQGRIMNIASIAAFQSCPRFAAYAATKAYVLNFSEAIAQELEGTGVSVMALCPGPTLTEFAREAHLELSRLFQSGGAMTARAVAEAAVHGLEKRQRVVIPGFRNRFLAKSVGLLPRRLITKIVANLHTRVSNNLSIGSKNEKET